MSRSVRPLLLLLGVLVVLAACTSGDDDATSTVTETTDPGVVAADGADDSAAATTTTTTSTPAPTTEPPRVWPDASTTGVPEGIELTPSGPLVVTTASAVVEGLEVEGGIIVEAPDVVIRNTLVRGEQRNLIDCDARKGCDRLVIEDTTIVGTGPRCLNGIGFSLYTARRVEISGCQDGAKANGSVTIEDSWIHGLRRVETDEGASHNDGIQSTGGAGVVIRGNRIEGIPRMATSAIKVSSFRSQVIDVIVEDNLLSGGSITMYVNEQGEGNPTGIVRDNVVLSGLYGARAWRITENPDLVFEGNEEW